ncbi:MAG TPA: tetraacyldisaccharide 4'-kinase [Pyrinomonadaceae bacterium]|nr:tetraacyldisaccharide 4'-kinase [Pyrinomonadaceae bacterium]
MLSWLYGKITNIRNSLYERGVLKTFPLGAAAISIGNITVGGTGKTPLVAFVAEILAEQGEKVCILTRGYGRENPRERVLVSDGEKILADVKKAGDEPFELANKLLGKAIVVADASRVAAAKWAKEKFKITAFVLDDAFQHRRANRDLDIVLLDATNPFGNSKTLPFGILREPLANLKRADLIVITRANLVENIADLKLQITNLNPNCPIFTAENKISNLTQLEEFHVAEAQSSQRITTDHRPPTTDHYFAFCALGNPDNFFEQLKKEEFNLVATKKFPDHHRYTQAEVEKLETEAKQTGAEILLTTAKDAVKLTNLKFKLPCFIIENRLVFDDEKKLREMIRAVLNPKSQISNPKSI